MRLRCARSRGSFAAARRYLVAALLLLVGAAPLALAQQAGGGAAANSRTGPSRGHDNAAGQTNGPSKDTSSAPANGAPQEHGSQVTKGARSGPPVDAGQGASERAGRRTTTRPSEGTKDRGAGVPAIDARHFPGHRVTRPIKDLLPKPYHFPKPATSVTHQPPVPRTGPSRNAIGVPLDHAPIAKPMAVTPPIAATSTAAPGASGGAPIGGTAPLRQTIAPPIPSLPQNSGLNGTAFSRVGNGPATLGGAARSTTGVNGTGFRSKHGN